MNEQPPALRFTDVDVFRGENHVLESVTAAVPLGGCTALVGPNGAGKTTLVRALLGELPYRGRIDFPAFPDAKGGRPRIGYVPQRLDFDRGLPLTVHEFLVLGAQRRPLWFGVAKKRRERAAFALAQVQAERLGTRRLGALSGGELQRVLLALALMREPQILILDEASSGVDVAGAALFCEVLENLRARQGFTQLMVCHDLSTLTHHATHVICLNRRVRAEGPIHEALTDEHLSATFGTHMGLIRLQALPQVCPPRAACRCARCREENGDNEHNTEERRGNPA